MIRFIFVFGMLMGLYYALLLVPAIDYLLYLYLKANAWSANFILHLFGQPTDLNEVTISTPGHSVSVRRGCDGTEPAWLFSAAVLAYPAAWRQKFQAVLVGAGIILGLNVVRIVSLYVIRLMRPAWFESAHLEIWPTIFIIVAVLLWITWLKKLNSGTTQKS